MGTRRKGRILAFQALYAWECSRCPIEELLEFSWVDSQSNGQSDGRSKDRPDDAGVPQSLVFPRVLIAGTIEHIQDVDSAIRNQLEHWDFDRLARVDLAILRMSAYALLYQPDIPASVTIDEAIDIAKEFGTDESYKFVNGVLDGVRKAHRVV